VSRDYEEAAQASYDEARESRERPLRRDGSRPTDGLAGRQDRISREQSRLEESIDLLGERLGPVLGPERPSAALAGGDSTEDRGSDLGRFLEHVATREEMHVARLRNLIERIDL
jgi:hypothetical protein